MNGGECPTIIGPMPFPGPAHRDVVARIAADHAVDLRRFLATRLADLSEREEVLQETFLRLAGYDAVADLDNPRAFQFRVAENLVRDRSRRARTRRRDLHEPLDGHHLTDPAPEPDIVVEHRDALTRTRAAILALDEPARTAFVMSRYREMSYGEIAATMGVSVKTVEKYVSAALAQLRLAVGSDRPDASLRREDRS